MNDRYKHDADGVSAIISSLKDTIEQYKDEISKLSNLVNEINGSSSWKDAQVKTSFIATCNSYINVYKQLSMNMERYVNYLSGKSSSAQALEQAFSR